MMRPPFAVITYVLVNFYQARWWLAGMAPGETSIYMATTQGIGYRLAPLASFDSQNPEHTMASGATILLKVTTIATICAMLVLSSSAGLAPAQRLCSNCEKDCSSSCTGSGSGSCGICSTDPNSSGCQTCKQAYYYKCMNWCGNSCRANCTAAEPPGI